MKLNIVDLGIMDYERALELQFKLLEKRQNSQIDDTLLIVEHPHVITLGKNAKRENILFSDDYLKEHDIDLVKIKRGGDVTYHGPGQIVGYPIVNIKEKKLGIKDFVYKLEEIFIDILSDKFDILAQRDEINNGVWFEDEKLTAVGLSVKRWVTMHGFAFNISTDLDFFKLIVPCGIANRGVTNVEKITNGPIDIEMMKNEVISYFIKQFGYSQTSKKNIEELED